MTEQMISQMVLEIKGSYKISYHANGPDEPPVEIDFTPPWYVQRCISPYTTLVCAALHQPLQQTPLSPNYPPSDE